MESFCKSGLSSMLLIFYKIRPASTSSRQPPPAGLQGLVSVLAPGARGSSQKKARRVREGTTDGCKATQHHYRRLGASSNQKGFCGHFRLTQCPSGEKCTKRHDFPFEKTDDHKAHASQGHPAEQRESAYLNKQPRHGNHEPANEDEWCCSSTSSRPTKTLTLSPYLPRNQGKYVAFTFSKASTSTTAKGHCIY